MKITDKMRLDWVFEWLQEMTIMEILELDRKVVDDRIRAEKEGGRR